MRQVICLLFAAFSAASAQQFEVASIKPSEPDSVRGWDGGPGRKDPTRYTFGQATLLDLIGTAWDAKRFQISSPVSLDRDRFDLAATLPENSTKEQFRAMLQNLLKERFGMKMHPESKEFPAYALVVAKGGAKLGSEEGPGPAGVCEWPAFPPGVARMASRNTPSGGYNLVCLKAQLQPISMLSSFPLTLDNVPVVDETGLSGKYNFTLGYTTELPGAAPDAPPVAPALFTALQQQLGLQLVSKKLPFDVVVVESINRLPTEN